jgi:heme/copper-type cytochrome/quinol oxidase subunit 3
MYEFAHLIQGAVPGAARFVCFFFTLVGTHGLHVAFGLDSGWSSSWCRCWAAWSLTTAMP